MKAGKLTRKGKGAVLSLGLVIAFGMVACTSTSESAVTSVSTTSVSGAVASGSPGADLPGPGPSVPVSVPSGYGQTTSGSQPTYAGGLPTQSSFSRPPIATTVVPAPGGGNVNQTVPSEPVTTLPALPPLSTATIGPGITANIKGVKSLTGVARGIGEVGGPAVALTLEVNNGTEALLDLSTVGFTVSDAAGVPSGALTGAPSAPLSGSLEPGKSATGVYVFTVPTGHKNPMQISISYGAGSPIALITTDVR